MHQPLAAGDALEPFEVGVTWWRRIDHLAAAHRRSRSEHDPVAALRDDRRGEAELRESPGADDAPEGRARAVVDKRAFRNRRELLQRDVEPVRVEDARLARFLEEQGRLVRVGDGYAVAPAAYNRARELLVEELERAGRITLARFRDLLGSSRKPAQLLLERFDADGITRRVGDERVLRRAAVRSPE